MKTRLKRLALSIKSFKVLSDIIFTFNYKEDDLAITLDGKSLLNIDPNEAYEVLYENGMAYDSGEVVVPKGSIIELEGAYECKVTLPNGKIAIMDLDLTDMDSSLEEIK